MTQLTVNCPHCGKPVAWDSTSKWRPFCSHHCRFIDLGAWLDEQQRIAGDPADLEEPTPKNPHD